MIVVDAAAVLEFLLLADLADLDLHRHPHIDLLTRLHSRRRVTLKTPAVVVIRAERDSA